MSPQIQAVFQQFKATNPPAPTSGGTDWYSGIKSGAYRPAQPTAKTTTADPFNPLNNTGQGGNPLETIKNAAVEGGEKVIQGDQEANPENGNGVGGLVEGVGKILGGGASAVTSPIAPVTAPVGTAVNAVGSKIQVPGEEKFANSSAGDVATHIASTVSDYANAAGTVAGLDTAPEVGGAIKDATTGTTDALSKVPGNIKSAIKGSPDKHLASTATDWQKPTTISKPAFNNARAVLDKSPDAPNFLAQQGLNPAAHIDETGRFDTADSAQALRDTANKMSNDTLRPSLQMADYTTPKTAVKDIASDAIKNATQDKTLTAGDKEKVTSNINREASALKTKFPDGMSLTDMHDNKITYAKNAGYSPIKSAADNNTATANRSLASAFQKTVEDKAPNSVPVKAFNNYLSQYHKGADYLDALNTKIAPTSIAKNIARLGAKATGAIVGSHLGGLPAEFAGYQVGRALEHAAENLTRPMRAQFLDNLEKTNPPAFTKVQQYLSEKNAGNPGILKLPAGAPKGATDNPHVTAPPSEASQMKGRELQLQSETPRDLSQAQATTPAIKSNTDIGSKPIAPSTKVKNPSSAGFMRIPTKIHPDDLATMKDFTDYVAGDYKPSASAGQKLEMDATRILEHYFPSKALPKTLQGIANHFGKVLDKN